MLHAIILTIVLTLLVALFAWILSETIRSNRAGSRIKEAYQKGWDAHKSVSDPHQAREIGHAHANGSLKAEKTILKWMKDIINGREEEIKACEDISSVKSEGCPRIWPSDHQWKWTEETQSWKCSTDLTTLGLALGYFPLNIEFMGIHLSRIELINDVLFPLAIYETSDHSCRLEVRSD